MAEFPTACSDSGHGFLRG